MEDNLGQVLLSFDLFFDSVWDVRDHGRQDELGKVNNVLCGGEEEEDTFMNSCFHHLFFECRGDFLCTPTSTTIIKAILAAITCQ